MAQIAAVNECVDVPGSVASAAVELWSPPMRHCLCADRRRPRLCCSLRVSPAAASLWRIADAFPPILSVFAHPVRALCAADWTGFASPHFAAKYDAAQ
jgi:hypothetical protein